MDTRQIWWFKNFSDMINVMSSDETFDTIDIYDNGKHKTTIGKFKHITYYYPKQINNLSVVYHNTKDIDYRFLTLLFDGVYKVSNIKPLKISNPPNQIIVISDKNPDYNKISEGKIKIFS